MDSQENDALPPREEAEEFYSRYELGEIIGQGTAVVRHCTLVETGEEFAVKIIDKTEDPESNKHIRAEIGFLNRLGFHPNISMSVYKAHIPQQCGADPAW